MFMMSESSTILFCKLAFKSLISGMSSRFVDAKKEEALENALKPPLRVPTDQVSDELNTFEKARVKSSASVDLST